MKRILFAIAVAITSGLIAAPAMAGPFIVNYQLNNVTFNDGGTALGSISAVFDPNPNPFNTFSQLLSVDITTTPGSLLAGAHYTSTALATGTAGPSAPFGQLGPFVTASFLQLSTPDQSNLFYLLYDQSIPVTPTATLQLLGTNQIPGEWHLSTTRAIVSGSLAPVSIPEPATWVIFLGGLGLTYAGLRRLIAAQKPQP